MKHTKILFALLLLFSMLMLSSCGIRTAKYDFELEGDIILKEGYRGESLSAFVYCTTTCVSGRDYFQNPSGLYYTSAELIAPDGTIYKFNPPVPLAVTQVNVKRGDVFKEHIFFEELPLDLAPGKYDLRVWNTTSGRSEKLFEDVTVRFDEEGATEQGASISDVQKAVKDYFDWQPPQDYFVVENYEDLQAVYEMASEIPKITDYLMVEGNWRQARKDNTYDQEYFKTGFLIVIMRTSNSMEEKITYNVNRVTDTTIHVTTVSYETVVEHPAAYLTVIPVEGQYKGQEISNVHIHNPLTYD